MARVLFLQNLFFEFMGPMYISSVLKENGHECMLFIPERKEEVVDFVRKSKPDIVAFSCMTGAHKWSIDVAKRIKQELGVMNIFGGPHPTFFPEMINNPWVDIICRGEGEYPMLELCNRIDRGEDIHLIKNLWVKKDGTTYKNEVRPLIENLDELPFPDRELYYCRYNLLKNLPVKRFITGRGCPYACSYCFNRALMRIYLKKGKYVRKRSVDNVIEEIKFVKEKYGLKIVRFIDDSFLIQRRWLELFSKKYRKEINLPFSCLVRPNELNERVVMNLKRAGCFYVAFGIESGSERIRNTVLKRNLTDQQIISAAKLLKKHKIKFATYNMLGIPTETIEEAFQTVELNALIGADDPTSTILQPYPGTEIAAYAKNHGLLDIDFNVDDIGPMLDHSVLKANNLKELINLQRLFYIASKYPKTVPIIERLIKLPPNPLFKLIHDLTFMISRAHALGLGLLDTLILALKLREEL